MGQLLTNLTESWSHAVELGWQGGQEAQSLPGWAVGDDRPCRDVRQAAWDPCSYLWIIWWLKREIELCVISVAMVGEAMCQYDGTQWCSVCGEEEGSKNRCQDGAAMFGRRPGRSAKTMLLFTFLLTFDFYFYTHNVGTDHLRQKYTLGHWKPLH